MADENTPLTIKIDVAGTEKAKKKLADFNKAIKKAADDSERIDLLQGLDISLKDYKGLIHETFLAYREDERKIQKEIKKRLKLLKDNNEVQRQYEKNLAKEKPITDISDYDKIVTYKNNSQVLWQTKIANGQKSVTKSFKKANTAAEELSTTLTKANGTFVESGELLGTVFSTKDYGDKTVTKTEELGDGFKTVREYVKLANGELYLLSQTLTKIKEKQEKVVKEKLPIGTLIKSGKTLGSLVSTKVFDDKTVFKTQEFANGLKIVREYAKLANGELYLLSQNTSKIDTKRFKEVQIKGSKADEILGKEILRTDDFGKTKIKTEETANGFKKIREYIKLANGELYLMSTRTTKVEEETTKLTKKQKIANFFKEGLGDLGKNASKQTKEFGKIFGRMGSIITYRIVRSMLSAITNAFKQGFSLLGSQNTAVSAIQEQFTAITTSLQVSLTTILIPLFQTLSNVLAPLSQTFIDIANAISYTNAKASEQSTFFQLSKEKIEDYAKAIQKTNKQLSQLDKFATLSGGSSSPILGEMVEVSEASDKVIKDTEKYQKVIDFFEKVNGVITKVFDGAEKLFNFVADNFELVIGLSYALLTALNPLASAIVSLGILMSDAAPGVKLLAWTLLTLSGALIAVGIAKEFTKNPYAGIAAAIAGALVAGTIGAIVGATSDAGTSAATNISTSPLNYSTTGYSSGSDLYSGIESATKNGYTSSGATRVSGDVYIDGVKAGRVLENSVYNEGVRVGHMGRK